MGRDPSPLLILTPMRSELVKALKGLGSGELVDAPAPASVRRYGALIAGWSGMGRGPTEATLRALAREEPGAVFHLGVAGGLRSGLVPGSAVLCERARARGGDEVAWETPEPWARALAPDAVGGAVTVDAVVSRPADKRALRSETGADVVEMETYWAARVALELGLPFVALRVVVDAVDDELPDLSAALDPVGDPKPLAMARRLARPGRLRRMPQLAKAFGSAQARLTQAVEAARGLLAQGM